MTSKGTEKTSNSTIGVDVSKDALDVHRWPDGAARRFQNDAGGIRALIRWLAGTSVDRVVLEPTGPFHRDLERALAVAGLPCAKVNPARARRFAEAAGRPAKTDRIDAAMLARFGAILEPDPRRPPEPVIEELKELRLARDGLIKDRVAARNRAAQLRLSLLRSQNARRLARIERDIAAVDAAIAALIESEPALGRRHRILCSIPGISAITAATLLAEMPELGAIEPAAAASLAGLPPIDRQSGRRRGSAHIRGGRAGLRRALYMPALTAARFNPDLSARYEKLRAAGKPFKLAITAIMRKLLLLANALLRDDREWSLNPP